MPSFTKDVIKRTFIDLLDQKPLHQITVKMIVELSPGCVVSCRRETRSVTSFSHLVILSVTNESIRLISLPIFQYDIQHLSRCYDIWLFREMLDIAGHQISIFFFSFLHHDFVKYPVFRIREFNIEFFRIDVESDRKSVV